MGSSYQIFGGQGRKRGPIGDSAILVACSPREYALDDGAVKTPKLPFITVDLLRSLHHGNVKADKSCLAILTARRGEWKIPPDTLMRKAEPPMPVVAVSKDKRPCHVLVLWTRNGEPSPPSIVQNLACVLGTATGVITAFVVLSDAEGHPVLHNQLRITPTPAVVLYEKASQGVALRQAAKRIGDNNFVAIVGPNVCVSPNWLLACTTVMRAHGLDALGLARATPEWAAGTWDILSAKWPKTDIQNGGTLWHSESVASGVVVYARGLILQGPNRVSDSSAYWDGNFVKVH